MKPERVINVHGHLRHRDDIAARIRLWESWNVVRFCCLCLHPRWRSPESGGYFTNDDFLKAKREYGDILIGMASVNLFESELDTPDDIIRYREQGFEGLKCISPTHPYDHEMYFPLYEKASQLGMPILFHTGHMAACGDGSDARYRVSSEAMRPFYLDKVNRVFPELKIIGAHLGNPFFLEALNLLKRPNVYFDISGGGGRKRRVRQLLSVMMPHAALETDWADPEENLALDWFRKFVFGTDNPEPSVWVPNSEAIMDRLRIPPETRRKYYFENAATLFGWSDL